jgi:hypothetical protein
LEAYLTGCRFNLEGWRGKEHHHCRHAYVRISKNRMSSQLTSFTTAEYSYLLLSHSFATCFVRDLAALSYRRASSESIHTPSFQAKQESTPPPCKRMRNLLCAIILMLSRFEKSLYDLIRGLRNHKGNEKEYIQNSLKECRAEIKGSDMGSWSNYAWMEPVLT